MRSFNATRHIVDLISRHWTSLAESALLMLFATITAVTAPMMAKLIIDVAVPVNDHRLLLALVAGALAVTLSSAALNSVRSRHSHLLESAVSHAGVLSLASHVLRLPVNALDGFRVGDLGQRFSDTRALGTFVARIGGDVTSAVAYLVLVPPILLFLNWRLALLACLIAPIGPLITALTGPWLRNAWHDAAGAQASASSSLTEVLAHARQVKTLCAYDQIHEGIGRQYGDALGAHYGAGVRSSNIAATTAMIAALANAGFVWYACVLIMRQELTLGAYVAFTAYLAYMTSAVAGLSGFLSDTQRVLVAASRLRGILNVAAESDEHIRTVRKSVLAVEVQDVTFAYSRESAVFREVSLIVPAGMTAVVGSSGAGKSTLLKLVCGIAQPAEGKIRIRHPGCWSTAVDELRAHTGVVWQEPVLFCGSLRYNLTLGTPSASQERIDDALTLVGLADFVASLPSGLDTPVAEWGATLSGGQKQRLCLARELVRDAPILLLDEVTANVDAVSESTVLRVLSSLGGSKVILIASHREATVTACDRVLYLSPDGRCVMDTHEALSRSDMTYWSLWRQATTMQPTVPGVRYG